MLRNNTVFLSILFRIYSAGLRILAFPCNQFNGQEPGTSEDICSFADRQKVIPSSHLSRVYFTKKYCVLFHLIKKRIFSAIILLCLVDNDDRVQVVNAATIVRFPQSMNPYLCIRLLSTGTIRLVREN